MARKKKGKAKKKVSARGRITPSPKALDERVQSFEKTHSISFEQAARLRYYMVSNKPTELSQLLQQRKLDLNQAKKIVKAFNQVRK